MIATTNTMEVTFRMNPLYIIQRMPRTIFAGNVVSEDFMKGVWKSVSYWSMIRKAGELVTHPLSAWETSDKNTGPTARHFAWMPAETTCLGRETPYR